MSEVLDDLTSNIYRERASISADKSHGKPDDDPGLVRKRQNLAALKLERHVRTLIAGWPKPTPEQLQRIAALLSAGGA
jgi:hypothetical protein